jgi:hypothetical protein
MDKAHLIEWLTATALSQSVRSSTWAWPVCEMLHFAGLSLLLGTVGLLDLRLLGFMRRIPITALRGLLPYGLAGFAVNLVTGVIFFIVQPEQYVSNLAFYFKLAFLAIAGANALFFETTQGHRLLAIDASGRTPTAFRVAGAVSILSWMMVLYWGRMLAFIGDSF